MRKRTSVDNEIVNTASLLLDRRRRSLVVSLRCRFELEHLEVVVLLAQRVESVRVLGAARGRKDQCVRALDKLSDETETDATVGAGDCVREWVNRERSARKMRTSAPK